MTDNKTYMQTEEEKKLIRIMYVGFLIIIIGTIIEIFFHDVGVVIFLIGAIIMLFAIFCMYFIFQEFNKKECKNVR